MSLPAPLPLWLAAPAAAFVVAAAWWTFGRRDAAPRRPWVVWAAGGAACVLVAWTAGFGYLLEREEGRWWPVVAVGLTFGWFAARGRWRLRTLEPGVRGLLAAAAALLFSAPLFAVTAAVLEARRETGDAVWQRMTGPMSDVLAHVVMQLPGRAAVGAVCGLVAFAALRSARRDDAAEGSDR